MYHGVERRQGPLFVDPSLFEEQLAAIGESGLRVVTVRELAEERPERAVALTFDDGFGSVVEAAAPRLADRGFSATVFCVAGRLGGTNDWPSARPGAPTVDLAPAAALAELAEAGFEIGGHGLEHAPLDTHDRQLIEREVGDGKTALEQAVGVPVSSFAYPYGAGPSAPARSAVAEAYSAACTTRIGRVDGRSDPHALERVDVHYLRSAERFAEVLAGRGNAYLAVRRAAATARRAFRQDYA
jgi:peptidoglycan/xylan/chitin deacetylase (PgdA/CDA1 family)